VVVYGPKELIVEYAIKLEFAVSNNGAEYKVIIVDLNVVEAAETDILALFSESKLVVGQQMAASKPRSQQL